MKRFSVSVLCECFATVEVEARSKKEAEDAAMKAKPNDWCVQQYTIIPRMVEKSEVVKE